MRRQITSIFLGTFLAISLFGCSDRPSDRETPNRNQETMNTAYSTSNGNTMNSNTMNSTAGMNTNSNTAIVQDNFWSQAAAGGMAEVELGRLASQKAQNAEVKRFAQMMVTDHTKANTELKAMADRKNVTLPTAIDASHKAVMDRLNGLSGAEFDRAYIDAMVEDHEDTVELFENNADNSDADIKAFAAKNLPVVRGHLDMIRNIQTKMK